MPLSLVGMLAYGTVTLLASRMATNPKDRFIEEEGLVKWLLLASTTVMGVASTYFMYILNDKLGGASCTYCVGSAILSISLLLCTLVVSQHIHLCGHPITPLLDVDLVLFFDNFGNMVLIFDMYRVLILVIFAM